MSDGSFCLAAGGTSVSMPQLHANALLNDRYRVRALLAMGGMAEVWVAEDTLLGRDVAVKVLRAGLADDPSAGDRLRAEARLAAKVRSEHVVRVHDVGELADSDGRSSPYLVMELVDGDTLRDHMLRGPLDPEQVRRFVTQIAEALAEAHALGVVHRDIKPANVLVTSAGDCKVTDFGISCSADTSSLTATGLVMGTARYLSPEQVRGRKATEASDVYSLGVVAHEALRGVPMFATATDVEAALAHVQQEPPALLDTVPPDLAALVHQMLAKEPGARPTAAAIASGQAPAPARAEAAAPVAQTRAIPLVTQPGRRRPKAPLAASLAGLVLITAAAATAWGSLDVSQRSADSSPATSPTPAASPAQPVTAVVTTVARTVPTTAAPQRVTAPAQRVPGKSRSHGKHKG